jgi:hypothetical protein
VKAKEVLERVYNPGRLRMAWQQVRKNAGAAGIDKKQGLIFLKDYTKRPLELPLFSH